MAVDLKANVSKAMIWEANYVGRSASIYHEGYEHVVGKVSKPCECKVAYHSTNPNTKFERITAPLIMYSALPFLSPCVYWSKVHLGK